MSEEISLLLENEDIVFNGDNQLVLIKGNNELAQQYKVLLETEFESDFRSPDYGFRLSELFNIESKDLEESIKLFVKETLLQHPKTAEILEITVERLPNRKWNVNSIVKTKPNEELLNVGSDVNV
jgi:phage baseplate assembly protein W